MKNLKIAFLALAIATSFAACKGKTEEAATDTTATDTSVVDTTKVDTAVVDSAVVVDTTKKM